MAQLMALVDIVTIMMHDVCSAAGCGGWPPRRRSWAPGSAGPRTSGSWSPAPRCGPASSCCSGTSCRSSGTTSSLPPSQRSRRAGAHMTRLSIGMMENVYSAADNPSVSQSVFKITEKVPSRAFSWLKALTSTFTFSTLLRHYAKRALTPW